MTEQATQINKRIFINRNSDEIVSLRRKFGFRCVKCGVSEVQLQMRLTVDHVIPLARGGENKIENYQPLCKSCNSSKCAKAEDYRGNPHPLCILDSGNDANAFVGRPIVVNWDEQSTSIKVSPLVKARLEVIRVERGLKSLSDVIAMLLEMRQYYLEVKADVIDLKQRVNALEQKR